MNRKQSKQTLKLRLLAFVLALALIWYSLNPSPKPVNRREKEDPDEKKRNLQPQNMAAGLWPFMLRPSGKVLEALATSDEDVDDFDWPEFIDG